LVNKLWQLKNVQQKIIASYGSSDDFFITFAGNLTISKLPVDD